MIHQIGRHLARHGDVTDGCGDLLAVAGHGSADFCYSDPPWGGGNLKYWRTMNKKMNPATAPDPNTVPADKLDVTNFLRTYFRVVRLGCHDDAVVWVEYGPRWRNDVVVRAGEVGLKVVAEGVPVYQSGKSVLPLVLLVFMWKPRPMPGLTGFAERVKGVKGYPTLPAATAGFGLTAGKTILDPCCGMGYTARLAVTSGMRFVGNELNEKRLGKTLATLRGKKA